MFFFIFCSRTKFKNLPFVFILFWIYGSLKWQNSLDGMVFFFYRDWEIDFFIKVQENVTCRTVSEYRICTYCQTLVFCTIPSEFPFQAVVYYLISLVWCFIQSFSGLYYWDRMYLKFSFFIHRVLRGENKSKKIQMPTAKYTIRKSKLNKLLNKSYKMRKKKTDKKIMNWYFRKKKKVNLNRLIGLLSIAQ